MAEQEEGTRVRVTIDRATWWRGNGSPDSALLRKEDGTMCCLGFLGLACGYSREQISGRACPSEVHGDDGAAAVDIGEDVMWPDGVFAQDDGRFHETYLCSDLMSVNDDQKLSEEHRERRLTELMDSAGIDVEFVGEGHPRLSPPTERALALPRYEP